MKHINLSTKWIYSREPFGAYRCSISHERGMLVVLDVRPATLFTVESGNAHARKVEYCGFDEAEARKAKETYDKTHRSGPMPHTADINPGPTVLPEGDFRVDKTIHEGTALVLSGRDDSKKCLLFVEISGGFRGDCGVKIEGTTGDVLKSVHATSNCDPDVAVIALLDVDQTLALWSTGQNNDDVVLYTWDGYEIAKKKYTGEEWTARSAVANSVA